MPPAVRGLRPGRPPAWAHRHKSKPPARGRCVRTRPPSQRARERAAIEQDVLPGDEAGLVGAEKGTGEAKFLRVAEAACLIVFSAASSRLPLTCWSPERRSYCGMFPRMT